MSDLLTFYRDTEPWIAAAAVSKYGDPKRDRTLLRAISPLRFAVNINVPLLVVHGELDTNVPIGEARQIVAALQALRRPVEYLQLDGEGHEYRRADSRLRLIATTARLPHPYALTAARAAPPRSRAPRSTASSNLAPFARPCSLCNGCKVA